MRVLSSCFRTLQTAMSVEPFLEQHEVAVPALAVGGRLVVEVGEAVLLQPVGKSPGGLGVAALVTVDVDHAEGLGRAHPAVRPEVEGVCPAKWA